jgi:hypothetical protein
VGIEIKLVIKAANNPHEVTIKRKGNLGNNLI